MQLLGQIWNGGMFCIVLECGTDSVTKDYKTGVKDAE